MNQNIGDIIHNYQSLATSVTANSKVRFEVSYYENGIPGTGITKHRKIVHSKDMSEQTISELLQNCPVNHELALHSRLWIDNICYHLPQIDFAHAEYNNYFLSKLHTIKSWHGGKLYVFKSGNSFHGYHDILLRPTQWKAYLGKLLLCNEIGAPTVTDTRWAGHALAKGFSALRISMNTPAYRQIPVLCNIL
jgi:hypothetical protein